MTFIVETRTETFSGIFNETMEIEAHDSRQAEIDAAYIAKKKHLDKGIVEIKAVSAT